MADSSRRSVKAIALSCGLWDLSRFADNYRKVFGELPRDTLMRAPAQIGSRPESSAARVSRWFLPELPMRLPIWLPLLHSRCRFRPWICRNARLPCRNEVRSHRCKR
jgi:hypothetical protein